MAACINLKVQVPNYQKLSKIQSYKATILKPNTELLGPLDPLGKHETLHPTSPLFRRHNARSEAAAVRFATFRLCLVRAPRHLRVSGGLGFKGFGV